MIDWKEVSPYTGQEMEEDAPANSVAGVEFQCLLMLWWIEKRKIL